jgi:hypothetical protein
MRLVDFDQSKLLPQERFHANGLELIELGGYGKTTRDRMVETLRELWEGREAGRIQKGFSWEQKMPNVFHLRPNVKDYSSVFLQFLWYNRIDQALENFTGRKMHLCHAQVVVQTPGPPHQDWHRDSYQYGPDPFVGAFPAAVKVNFYPQFDKPEPRLKFVRGSHRCQANDARFDAMLIGKYENEVLESSNDRVLMFDSSMLHAVVPDQEPKGSIRVMYSFAMEHEYKKRFAHKEHHRRLHDEYEAYIERDASTKLERLENEVRRQLNRGYPGNPYVNDLECELKWDGEQQGLENVLDKIESLKKEERE